jgi:hypothetical protein
MRLNSRLTRLALVFLVLASSAEAQTRRRTTRKPTRAPAPAPTSTPATVDPSVTVLDERQLYMNAARTAWAFVTRNYQPATGLARAHDTYQYVTLWDVASGLAATYSAHELGLVADPVYQQRMQRALTTLSTMDLFDRAAFNKSYDSRTGRMIDRSQRLSSRGYGWSTTDLGRLLIWLKIIGVNQPQFASQTAAIVKRFDMSRIIANGYLQGQDLNPLTGQMRMYPESRIGYEQYAAAGFALWGFRADNALNAQLNAQPVEVLGIPLIADKRGGERITSEPYIMMGMETGWYSPELRQQARRVLAVQEARYRSTGTITMASEDALPDPPYYFYYYNIFRDGRSFTVDAPAGGGYVDRPRWISSKAAFAWHALLPTPYTLTALQAVQGAAIPGRGWGAGVYEGSLRPTGDASLNTAALILEAALYQLRGHPFLTQTIQ